jgi:hypothetical protein
MLEAYSCTLIDQCVLHLLFYEFQTLEFDTLFFEFCAFVLFKAEMLTSSDITGKIEYSYLPW